MLSHYVGLDYSRPQHTSINLLLDILLLQVQLYHWVWFDKILFPSFQYLNKNLLN